MMRKKGRVAIFNGFSTRRGEKGKLFAPVYHSCECRGGVLRRGVGVKPYLQADGSKVLITAVYDIVKLYPIRYNESAETEEENRYAFVQENGYLYELNTTTGASEFRFHFSLPLYHHACKTEDRKIMHIFSCPTKVLATTDLINYSGCASGTGLSCCIVGGRSFIGMDSRTIKYSKPHAIDDFEEASNGGGRLYLPDGNGRILSLQTDGEYLYAFLEQEIYRIKVGADGMDFAVERVEYDGGAICSYSMAETAKGIVFLSLSGIYLLRGRKAEWICRRLPVRPTEPDYVCAVGFCEELVLIDYRSLNADGSKTVRRVAISVEEDDGFFCERYGTLGGSDLCVIAGVVHQFVKDDKSSIYPYMPQFESEKLDFGTRAQKYLKRLRVEGSGSVEVSVQGHGAPSSYFFDLDGNAGEEALSMAGKEFVIRIYPAAGAEVRSLQIEYACMEDGYGY